VIASYTTAPPAESPTLQGWSEGGNLAVPAAGGSETIGGTTYRYWDISNTYPASNAASRFYRRNFTSPDLPAATSWTATAFLRVESAPPEGSNAFLEVAYGSVFWSLNLTRTSAASSNINYISSTGAFVSLGSFDTAADYFYLQMYYDADAGQLQVYVNGDPFGDPLAGSAFRSTAPSNLFVRWGDNDGSGRATTTLSHWNAVRLETGYAVVPEPGALAVLGGGLLLTGLYRRKRFCLR